MLVLGIDTSTKAVAVGLWSEEGLVAEISGTAHLTHSERLLVHMIALLDSAGLSLEQLDGIGVVVGPGSFTGLRIGVATAQGLAESRGLPTIGLSSLEVLALGADCGRGFVCPLIVARKGYVYAAIYEISEDKAVPVRAPVTCPPEELVSWIDRPTVFVGEGFMLHRALFRAVLKDRIIEAPEHSHRPSGRVVSYCAYKAITAGHGHDPALLLPEYLGPCTAEINWERRQAGSSD